MPTGRCSSRSGKPTAESRSCGSPTRRATANGCEAGMYDLYTEEELNEVFLVIFTVGDKASLFDITGAADRRNGEKRPRVRHHPPELQEIHRPLPAAQGGKPGPLRREAPGALCPAAGRLSRTARKDPEPVLDRRIYPGKGRPRSRHRRTPPRSIWPQPQAPQRRARPPGTPQVRSHRLPGRPRPQVRSR